MVMGANVLQLIKSYSYPQHCAFYLLQLMPEKRQNAHAVVNALHAVYPHGKE